MKKKQTMHLLQFQNGKYSQDCKRQLLILSGGTMFKKYALLLVLFAAPVWATSHKVIYGNFSYQYDPNTSSGFVAQQSWNLMQGDVVVSYTADLNQTIVIMNGATMVATPQLRVGLVQGDKAPADNYSVASGTAAYCAIWPPIPASYYTNGQDWGDRVVLDRRTTGGWDPNSYDASGPETIDKAGTHGFNSTHGMIFDRNNGYATAYPALTNFGNHWNNNTNGIYNVVIRFHAIDSSHGTAFVTVNAGLSSTQSNISGQQGLYPCDPWWGCSWGSMPSTYPIGMSFTGNMANMKVFLGIGWGRLEPLGTVTISNLTADYLCNPISGDFDNNCFVDFKDFAIFAANWFKS
jgi:hypothetical protein